MMVPVLDSSFEGQIEAVKNLILAEVNVKELEFLSETSGVLSQTLKLLVQNIAS